MKKIKTSGTTSLPKIINYSDEKIKKYCDNSINLYKFTRNDKILNLYPEESIATFTLTSNPVKNVGGQFINFKWDTYKFLETFNNFLPTIIGMAPIHLNILKKTKQWDKIDFSCCRCIILGSDKVYQEDIDLLLSKGTNMIFHTYGMTENPPPVMIGENSEWLNLNTVNKDIFKIDFKYHKNFCELLINGKSTDDYFEKRDNFIKFLKRNKDTKLKNWKTGNY